MFRSACTAVLCFAALHCKNMTSKQQWVHAAFYNGDAAPLLLSQTTPLFSCAVSTSNLACCTAHTSQGRTVHCHLFIGIEVLCVAMHQQPAAPQTHLVPTAPCTVLRCTGQSPMPGVAPTWAATAGRRRCRRSAWRCLWARGSRRSSWTWWPASSTSAWA